MSINDLRMGNAALFDGVIACSCTAGGLVKSDLVGKKESGAVNTVTARSVDDDVDCSNSSPFALDSASDNGSAELDSSIGKY